jgi:hypothetical protein
MSKMEGWEDYDPLEYGEEEERPERPRDLQIDKAKEVVMARIFGDDKGGVYYQRQVEVILEREVFHWITRKALRELGEEGRLIPHKEQVSKDLEALFYRKKGIRYWRREVKRIGRVIVEYARLGRAIGAHAEMLFDAALGSVGFRTVARDVRSFEGREWTRTGHDLDRILERDGIYYGEEIKNALDYIPRDELGIKLEMCRVLELRPLFVMRMAAKSYVFKIVEAGGYALLFGTQLYPFGHEELMERVKALGLPVDSPRRISDGMIKRFLIWHERTRLGGKKVNSR